MGGLATALTAFRPPVRVNPCGHGSRVGLDLVGNDDALPLRNPLGVQQLGRTDRFGLELPALITVDFLGRVLVEELSADRYRRLVALGRLDTLLPHETIGKPFHGGRWRIRSGAVADRGTKQRRPAGGSAILELADDA